jgi:hypothetical protein
MLNYLGPNIGPNPITASLPAGVPGTMPGGIPAGRPAPTPSPTIHPHAAAPPSALAAIMNSPGAPSPGPEDAPQLPEYDTVTQEDGSILLHIKNPDGSLGPVVRVLPPIKTGKQSS